jgi:Co/Zn/Cd efflux system component
MYVYACMYMCLYISVYVCSHTPHSPYRYTRMDSDSDDEEEDTQHAHSSGQNINVSAAFVHVVGDAIQSVGVMIAGALIWCVWLCVCVWVIGVN